MKTKILGIAFFLISVSLVLSSYVNGPASHGWDCTGGESDFQNPTGCSTGGGCHASAATAAITVDVELDSAGVAVTHYVGGKSYTVKLTGTNTTSSVLSGFGFQIASATGSTEAVTPTNAGTWGTAPAQTHIAAPRASDYNLNIVEQTSTIAATSGGGATGSTYAESFTWTAPAAGTGTISFWAALNAVNNNNNADNGDLWNTQHLIVNEEDSAGSPATGIKAIANAESIRVYPNPVADVLNLQWDNAQTGAYTLSVYNISGQLVAYQQGDFNASVNTKTISSSAWASGIYIVNLKTDNNQQVLRVVKQ